MYIEVKHIPSVQSPGLTWVDEGPYIKVRDFDETRTMIRVGGAIAIINNRYLVDESA